MAEAEAPPPSCADVTVLLCVPRRVQERLQELHQGQAVHGVRFLLHDPDPEVEDGPPLPLCDLVVHKAVNDLALLRDGDAAAAARYATLQKLAARGVPMLDPLEAMPLFADRGAPVWSKSSLGSAPARLLRLLTGLPASPLGTQPLPRVLELAASNAAHFFAFDHPGALCRALEAAGGQPRPNPNPNSNSNPNP